MSTSTKTRTQNQTTTPGQWKVLLLNDDYTPMDFVVEVLETVFRKSEHEAVQIMYAVHRAGVGLAGVYTHEIAETKLLTVEHMARAEGHPLQCTMEPE
jgi:ATP-dependent Clp protease adaptor protein ClpS